MSGIGGSAALVLIAYLLGAIPFGLLVARVRGVDLRRHGSGRTGATNALRTVGAAAAVTVLIADVAKGVVAVLLVRWLYDAGSQPDVAWVAAAAGLAAIIGHVRSVFIGFRGGRGVATTVGGLLAVSPWTVAVLAPVVLLIIWRSRYVSLGSVSGALLVPVVTGALALAGAATAPAFAFALAAGALVTWSHADNITRLRAGTERRLGEKETITGHG